MELDLNKEEKSYLESYKKERNYSFLYFCLAILSLVITHLNLIKDPLLAYISVSISFSGVISGFMIVLKLDKATQSLLNLNNMIKERCGQDYEYSLNEKVIKLKEKRIIKYEFK